tara:strand:- start:11 stop:367 length:357 start_codon:yes stop_codon:yes gene_type:complete
MDKALSPHDWRESAGYTLRSAADRFGVIGKNPARTWQRWETGERSPSVAIIAEVESASAGAVSAASWAQVRNKFISEQQARAHDSKAAHISGSSSHPKSDNPQSPSRSAQTDQQGTGS